MLPAQSCILLLLTFRFTTFKFYASNHALYIAFKRRSETRLYNTCSLVSKMNVL